MTGAGHMEPMLPDVDSGLDAVISALTDSTAALAETSRSRELAEAVESSVRVANAYCSNRIEGHTASIAEIERALGSEFADDTETRHLQIEATAHIDVQLMIDEGGLPYPATSAEGICWIHRGFCRRLPLSMLVKADPATGRTTTMVPGEIRTRHVVVGRHEAPEPEAVKDLLGRFSQAYSSKMLSPAQKLAGIAAAHHRLVWIHPFLDGNGRVARLVAHAMLRDQGLRPDLWPLSRGLLLKVDDYKARLAAADEPRRGDLDGRGSLTEAGLRHFCQFFLFACLDQVDFMHSLHRTADVSKPAAGEGAAATIERWFPDLMEEPARRPTFR